MSWWQSLKQGDIMLWSMGEWRYKGVIKRVEHRGQSVMVDIEERWTRADAIEENGVGPEQKIEALEDTVSLTAELLLSDDFDWTYRKAADIRMKLKTTADGRNFKIWGDGEGSRDMPGAGGGLTYMDAESPLPP